VTAGGRIQVLSDTSWIDAAASDRLL
jgi:hypothetical protein